VDHQILTPLLTTATGSSLWTSLSTRALSMLPRLDTSPRADFNVGTPTPEMSSPSLRQPYRLTGFALWFHSEGMYV